MLPLCRASRCLHVCVVALIGCGVAPQELPVTQDGSSGLVIDGAVGPAAAKIMPIPTRTFAGYIPDGGYKLQDGPGTMPLRQIAIAAMPSLGRYGFGRYVSPAYPGVSRSVEDAALYYGPLVESAKAAGMKFIPGLWLHHLIDAVYGAPNDPPWNVTGPEFDLSHPKNPSGLLNPAVWDQLVERALVLARGAHSNQVYVDAEYVFWRYRYDAFWTDETLAAIRPMVHSAVQELRDQGVFLIMYHPNVNPTVPELRKIATALFSPQNDPNDPLVQVEHFAPSPYFKYLPGATHLPEPAEIDATHVESGFFAEQVRYGFISNHAQYGLSAAEYDEYCRDRPGIAERTWFFCNYATVPVHAADFEALAAAQHPAG